MRAFFRHIRRQPENVRERYALGIAGTFTGVVVLFWAMARFDTPVTPAPGTLAQTEPTIFATLMTNSKEQFAKLKTALALNSATTSAETNTAAVLEAVDPAAIVLSPEELKALSDKASSTENQLPPPTYTEVLIGTTSASTATTASSSAAY